MERGTSDKGLGAELKHRWVGLGAKGRYGGGGDESERPFGMMDKRRQMRGREGVAHSDGDVGIKGE